MANRSATFALASLAIVAMPITAYAAAEPAKDSAYYTKKICTVSTPTGSRLGGVRRCRTQAEEDERKSGTQSVTKRMQSQKNFTEQMYRQGAGGMCKGSLKC